MSLIEDVIKIRYVNMGYLPDTPYHLISEIEMIDAFRRESSDPLKQGVFQDFYPCPATEAEDENVYNAYHTLKDKIQYVLEEHLNPKDPNKPEYPVIPNWVYSYMLLRPIGPNSPESDIAYMYNLLNEPSDNGAYLYTPHIAFLCLRNSESWLTRTASRYRDRVPTVFGETYVTKSLRLDQANITVDERRL